MSKVREQNYVVIQGWMLSKLQLKGNDLLIYAIIYGFSQNIDCKFTGSLQYLADWTNSTKQGVLNSLKNLLERKLITKKDYTINGVKFVEYYSNDFNRVFNKVEQGYSNDFNGSGQQSLTNKTKDNTIDNNNNINDKTNTASGFSQSENSVVNDSFTTQNPTVKEILTVQKPKKEIEIIKKDDIESFVRTFKASEFEVDGVVQLQSVFSENEIELITGYLLRRKEKHKSKAKCSQQAIKAILNKILEIKGIHALEVVFEQRDGCYVNCGTAGDPTTPWIRLELEYFTKLIKKPTFNNQYAKPKPDYFEVQKRYASTGELSLSTNHRKRRD